MIIFKLNLHIFVLENGFVFLFIYSSLSIF